MRRYKEIRERKGKESKQENQCRNLIVFLCVFMLVCPNYISLSIFQQMFKWAHLGCVHFKSKIQNFSLCTDIRYSPDSNNRNLVTQVQELASAKEVWFRAAVIAVPIAGGLILVLLIMLALRMLRSENKRLQDQRQQMLSRLHYSFHSHHNKKGHVAKLDLECMVQVTGHENCCLTCDKMRQADLGNDKILSLVHWGMYSGHSNLEFVWPVAGNYVTITSTQTAKIASQLLTVFFFLHSHFLSTELLSSVLFSVF